jgi:hypothetical protein
MWLAYVEARSDFIGLHSPHVPFKAVAGSVENWNILRDR